jgi:hypothetical protein
MDSSGRSTGGQVGQAKPVRLPFTRLERRKSLTSGHGERGCFSHVRARKSNSIGTDGKRPTPVSPGVFVLAEDTAFAAISSVKRASTPKRACRIRRCANSPNTQADIPLEGRTSAQQRHLGTRVVAGPDPVSRAQPHARVIGKNWIDAHDVRGKRRLDDKNDFVRLEVESALKRDIAVIPLLVDGATMLSEDQLPDGMKALAKRHAIELTHARFGPDAQALISSILGSAKGSRDEARRSQASVRPDQVFAELVLWAALVAGPLFLGLAAIAGMGRGGYLIFAEVHRLHRHCGYQGRRHRQVQLGRERAALFRPQRRWNEQVRLLGRRLDTPAGNVEELLLQVNANEASAKPQSCNARGAQPNERIADNLAGLVKSPRISRMSATGFSNGCPPAGAAGRAPRCSILDGGGEIGTRPFPADGFA